MHALPSRELSRLSERAVAPVWFTGDLGRAT
jgi:hypothetical protein